MNGTSNDSFLIHSRCLLSLVRADCRRPYAQVFSTPDYQEDLIREDFNRLLKEYTAKLSSLSAVHCHLMKQLVAGLQTSSEGEPMTVSEKALYVILKTAPDPGLLARPGTPTTKVTLAVAESAGRSSGWSKDLDPFVQAGVGYKTQRQCSFVDTDNDGGGGDPLRPSGPASRIFRLSRTEERCLAWNELFKGATIYDNSSATKAGGQGSTPVKTRRLSPSEEKKRGAIESRKTDPVPFSFDFSRSKVTVSSQTLMALYYAMHCATIGQQDHFQLLLIRKLYDSPYNAVEISPRLALAARAPLLHSLGGPPPATVRALVGPLVEACHSGNLCLRLQALADVFADRDARPALGSIGAAALSSLRAALYDIFAAVASSELLLRSPSIADFLVANRRLAECRECVQFIAAIYFIRIDKDWRPSHSLLYLSNATFLSHLFEIMRGTYKSFNKTAITIVNSIFNRTLSPLFKKMFIWVHKTTLIDPYSEFFIVSLFNKPGSNHYLIEASPSRMPSFISQQTATYLLVAGLAREVLVKVSKEIIESTKGDATMQLVSALIESFIVALDGHSKSIGPLPSFFHPPCRWDAFVEKCEDLLVGKIIKVFSPERPPSEISSNPPAIGEVLSLNSSAFEASAVGDQTSSTESDDAERGDSLEVIKEKAKQRMIEEHWVKMRILEYQHSRALWKSRRLRLNVQRKLIINSLSMFRDLGIDEMERAREKRRNERDTFHKELKKAKNISNSPWPISNNLSRDNSNAEEDIIESTSSPRGSQPSEKDETAAVAEKDVNLSNGIPPVISASNSSSDAIMPYDRKRVVEEVESGRAPPQDKDMLVYDINHDAFSELVGLRSDAPKEKALKEVLDEFMRREDALQVKMPDLLKHTDPEGPFKELAKRWGEPETLAPLLPQHYDGQNGNSIQSIAYISAFSLRIASYYSLKALQFLLLPKVGPLSNALLSLNNVLLLQSRLLADGLTHEWSSLLSRKIYDTSTLMNFLKLSFHKVWEKQPANPRLIITVCTREGCSASARIVTPFKLLETFDLKLADGLGKDYLFNTVFPKQMISRFADVFVCLLFWRFTRELLDQLWWLSRQFNEPSVWLFSMRARAVMMVVGDNIWYRVSAEAVRLEKEITQDSGQYYARTRCSLALCREELDNYLERLHLAALLAPAFARVRRHARGMVGIIEDVLKALNEECNQGSSQKAFNAIGNNSHIGKLALAKLQEFTAATDILLQHLEGAMSMYSDPSDTDHVTSIIKSIQFL